MPTLLYQPTILQGTTKTGKIKCDPDGYYDLIVGAFDAYNSQGAFYTWASAKTCFEKSHHLQRRIANSALYGEWGHPVKDPRWTKEQWLVRVLTVDIGNQSHHIRELHYEDKQFTNKDGKPMVVVYARLKPAGPKAQALGDSLDNEHENTAFSIRSLTDDYVDPYSGIVIKNMREIVTYDRVDEPGINIATKYHNPALESLNTNDLGGFNAGDFERALKHVKNTYSGMEATSLVDTLEGLLECSQRKLVLPETGIIGSAKRPITYNW